MNSKWIAVVLVVSLAANLALVGFILGRVTQPDPGFDPTRAFPRWAKTLPEHRREELRPAMRAHFNELRPRLRQMRRAHKAVREALVAQPLDPERLRQTLNERRKIQDEFFKDTDLSFVNFVLQLTPDERRAFAQRPLIDRGWGAKRPPRTAPISKPLGEPD